LQTSAADVLRLRAAIARARATPCVRGSAPSCAPCDDICDHNAPDTVIVLPPSPSDSGAINGMSRWPMPSVEATTIGPSMCAASK